MPRTLQSFGNSNCFSIHLISRSFISSSLWQAFISAMVSNNTSVLIALKTRLLSLDQFSNLEWSLSTLIRQVFNS